MSDLAGLDELLDESGDLKRMMHSPTLSRDEQSGAVVAVAEHAGVGELTSNFLGLLAQKRRLIALEGIIAAFRAMVAEHRGEVRAEIITAQPVDEQQLQRMRESVSSYAGKEVNMTTSVDPSLLGGLVVRIGSHMIDASIKSKLAQLELAMKGSA